MEFPSDMKGGEFYVLSGSRCRVIPFLVKNSSGSKIEEGFKMVRIFLITTRPDYVPLVKDR